MTERVGVSSSIVQVTSEGMPIIESVCVNSSPSPTLGTPCGQPEWIVSHSPKRAGSLAKAKASSGVPGRVTDFVTDGMRLSPLVLEAHRLTDELLHDLVGSRVDPPDPGVHP